MSHTHYAGKIEYRGKADSVYITCLHCDKIECVGTWCTTPYKGWSKRQWPRLIEAITIYLSSFEWYKYKY